jgi:hypothetical protein
MIPGTPWELRKDFIGPKFSDGSDSKVYWRCESGFRFMSHGGPCHIAFESNDGEKIELDDVLNELDNYMWKNTEFRQWVVPPDHKGVRSSPWNSAEFPYQIHLLTVNPTVFLAVPKRKDDYHNRCRSTSYQTGCYSGHLFYDEPFQTNSRPRFIPGSFWFAPSFDMSTHQIPANAAQYTIQLPSSSINLNAVDGFWTIERSKGKKGTDLF